MLKTVNKIDYTEEQLVEKLKKCVHELNNLISSVKEWKYQIKIVQKENFGKLNVNVFKNIVITEFNG